MDLTTKAINKLIVEQSVPASIGFLIMSINSMIDVFFMNEWIGHLSVASLVISIPWIFFLSSFGIAIGVGGSSLIARCLGEKNIDKAKKVFKNQILLTFLVCFVLLFISYLFRYEILYLFGAKGDQIKNLSIIYYNILLIGTPFLTFSLMGNSVIRSEGSSKEAMIALIIPAVVNLILDVILIKYLDLGITGAAIATSMAYLVSMMYIIWYFSISKKSNLRLKFKSLRLDYSIIKDIASIGSVTIFYQIGVSVLVIFLNNSILSYGNEITISIYGIISNIMSFLTFPIFGLSRGCSPIIGHNYGGELYERVKDTVITTLSYGTIIMLIVVVLAYIFSVDIAKLFFTKKEYITIFSKALILIFLSLPLISFYHIGVAYFQSLGKVKPALIITFSRQIIFVLLLMILPLYYELNGVWYVFPIAELVLMILVVLIIKKSFNKDLSIV